MNPIAKIQEKEFTEWIFKRFNELTAPHMTAQQREEILYRVFSMLQKCDKSWQCQLDILDVFGNIIKNKAEILFGCGNILDLVITMIENLENNDNYSIDDENININTIHCKLCHLISIVGRTQLSVGHLTRILILLRDSLLNKNRKALAPLLLSTLKDMCQHSQPFYDNHSLQMLNVSPSSASDSNKNKKKRNDDAAAAAVAANNNNNNNEINSWIPSPQKIITNKAKSIVSVFSDRWFQSETEQARKEKAIEEKKQKQKEKEKEKKKQKKREKEKAKRNKSCSNTNSNNLQHIIHQLPLSSFAFFNREKKKQCSIDVPMKYIKKWPYSNGFSFVCWILFDQLSPHIYNKNSWMTIISMLTTSGYGIHISLCCKSGSIKIRITAKNIVDEKIIPKARLLASTWYFIAITHCQSRTAALRLLRPSHSNGQCKVYINGNKVCSVDIEYVSINEKPKYCSIGKSSFPSSLNTQSAHANESSFCGQFGSIYFFGNPLSSNQIHNIYSFGANYMIKPEIVKQSNANWINNKHNKLLRDAPISMQTNASSIESEIFQNLMFGYHPLATEISNKLCLNVGSSIYLHGKLNGDIEIFKTKDVRNIFHCNIGGITSLFPILTVPHIENTHDDELISFVFDLIAQLLHFSLSNQLQVQRSSGIIILGYLLQQIPSKCITTKVLTAIHNFCCHLSWLSHEDKVNGKTAPVEDSILFTHLPPSLSSSQQFNELRPKMDLSDTKNQHNLFNQSVNYLILNFKIWHREHIDDVVENQLVQILTIWCKDQPKYMYQLIHIGFLLNEVMTHYSYKKVKNETNKKRLWNIRQYWFNIIIYLIQNNLMIEKNSIHPSSLQHIDLLLQMAVELTDPLECGDMMEIIVALIDNTQQPQSQPQPQPIYSGIFSKKYKSDSDSNRLVINHLVKKHCMKLFGVLFREQCQDRDYLQVCCLHLINVLNLYCDKEEEEPFVVSLVSSFIESDKEIPLVTYHALLEVVLFVAPGSIGVKHGTEFFVKKHELIQSKHYMDHLQNALIKYPQSLIQLLRCKFDEKNNEKNVNMKTVLKDVVSLLATSNYNKENASLIVASRGFQEPFIKLIDFCNIHLQSDTDSLSWYGETCLDLLLQYSLLYDNRGWKILRDTLRLMRYYCEHSKISLIYCVISQCYLFIRILKRLASLIHTDLSQLDTNIVIVNLVRCLELIEIIIYELPPGLFSYKIDDWVLMNNEDDDVNDDNINMATNEIDCSIMDDIWILLCSSILSVLESIPKCNLSPSVYRDISSPPLKTGSPFRVLLRLLLSCLERNIECETKTASIKSLIQNALQFLCIEQHPSMKYIGSLSFVIRRFHCEEMNNQFTIYLVKSLHDLFVQCKNQQSKHYLLKLIEFVVKSREPISFVPVDMFNAEDNLFLTCKVNNGEMFASIVDEAKTAKLTHFAIPITSKLLSQSSSSNITNHKYSAKDMGFMLNFTRFKLFATSDAKTKRIEIMITERMQNDIAANMKFICNLNFVNFEKGNVEVLESNAIRKLLERMDNRQRNYLEYYKNNMLEKERDKLNKYAYTEANRKVFSLNQSDEKLKRGKMYWVECKPHIYCQGSVWFDAKENTKKKFWQMDHWENKHRMRLKLMEYKGGLIKTRSAGDSHSYISNISNLKSSSNASDMHNLTQSIANLDEWGIFNADDDSIGDTDEEKEREREKEKEREDEWDYCEDSFQHNINYELEDMIVHECDDVYLVSNIGRYQGQIKITRSYFQFIATAAAAEEEEEEQQDEEEKENEKDKVEEKEKEKEKRDKIFSLPALNKIRLDESRDRYISLDQIHAVFRRRYQLQHSALEIYLLDGKSYLFDVGSKQKRNDILKVLFSHNELVGCCPCANKLFSRKPMDILAQSDITERWKRYEISNFDYLMLLNTISGRTYNDVNQYPVFPWVLTDYVSPELDLSNPSVFRDLSKPMGALNPDRLKTIIKKYKGLLADTSVPAFHYGSHYSNGAIVISYLLRLEPFSSLHIELQGGKWDFADRLFSSMQQSWDAVISSLTTFKELIPEFFYLPHMLQNVNCYDLGRRQNGQLVDDVKLPPWATSAHDFVRKHRAALESPYVSAHLHHWVDLIWGYKQRGAPAEEANNLFYHLTYEGAVKLDEMDDEILKRAMKEQIANFGQTPIQLFHKPHTERDPSPVIIPYAWKIGNKYQKIPCLHEMVVNKQTAIQQLLILNKIQCKEYHYNVLITISVNGYPVGHTLYLEDKENKKQKQKHKHKIRIPSIVRDLYTYRTPPMQFDTPSFVLFEHSHSSKYHPSSLTKATSGCIAYNNNIVYVGNNWDSSLRVYRLECTTNTNNIHHNDININNNVDTIEMKTEKKQRKPHLGHIKWRLLQSFISHKSRISCIDTDGIHLASGSDDCTVVIWQINNKMKAKNMAYFTFDLLLNHNKRVNVAENNGIEYNHFGLISSSKCVLRGHQSPIVAVALNSELDICVSCSSQGLILIHTVLHGEYRYSLYLSSGVCGRGTILNNLQFTHVPDNDDNDNNKNGGDRCQIDIVKISCNGLIVFLSKTCNMIFSCDINGMNWNSLKVTDNLTTIDIDESGKFLLTGGQCGIAKIRYIHNLSRNVYKFLPVGDSITIVKFHKETNRVYISTESGNLHLFALPHLTRIRSIIDTLSTV